VSKQQRNSIDPAAKNTRDRILQSSLRLFNDAGAASVSTNRIAAELEISAGNLYYHFKNKEQIVEVLVRRFEQRLAPIDSGARSIKAVDDLWLALHLTFEAIHDYRFVFRDADYLMRSFPVARKRLQAIIGASIKTTQALCVSLVDAGILKITAEELQVLAFHIVFTATCWSMFAKLAPGDVLDSADTGRAAYHVLTLLTPYMTEDSRHYMIYLRSKYRS
jgi:AcrR family transcriptional regulator